MENQKLIHDLEVFAAELRLETVKMSASLGFDLAAGALSLADAVAVLYCDIMRTDPKNTTRKDRDWFVLSEERCAPVLYAALNLKGYVKNWGRYAKRTYLNGEEERDIIPCEPDFKITKDYDINAPFWSFSMNADRDIKNGVEFTTGSPGHGLSQAAGAALGNRIQGRRNRVYIAINGRETESGQTWEAVQFAARHKLNYLICLVDCGKMQCDEDGKESNSEEEICAKFHAFGWNVIHVQDGNDIAELHTALSIAKDSKEKPVCVVLNTTPGNGVPCIEESGMYSIPMTQEQWDKAAAVCEATLEAVRAK